MTSLLRLEVSIPCRGLRSTTTRSGFSGARRAATASPTTPAPITVTPVSAKPLSSDREPVGEWPGQAGLEDLLLRVPHPVAEAMDREHPRLGVVQRERSQRVPVAGLADRARVDQVADAGPQLHAERRGDG